jgi:hypothetical protein
MAERAGMGRTTVKSQKKQGSIIEKIQEALDLPASSVTENAGSHFEERPAAISQADAIAGQRRVKGIRQLVSVASTVFFFAFVFWQFRDVIFRLL